MLNISENNNEQRELISSLYESIKKICKDSENALFIDESIEQELNKIQESFEKYGDKTGPIFCQKAFSIIHEKRGDLAIEIEEKINHYENAHDSINSAIIQANKIKWYQPSLFKRQGIIKSKLGTALHSINDHHDANILERDAFKIFGELVSENPSYAEGLLELATASFKKTKWLLVKILTDLDKADELLNNPRYKRHLPDANELSNYRERMDNMSIAIHKIIDTIEQVDSQRKERKAA